MSPTDPRLPSALYYWCGRCEKKSGSLEAGSEDVAGNRLCRMCTKAMYLEAETSDRLKDDPEFMSASLARYYAMVYRRPRAVDPPTAEHEQLPRRSNWRTPLT